MTATPYIPRKLQLYGLRDAHVRPFVSTGKRADGSMSSFRVDPRTAWTDYPSLELCAGNSWSALTLDIDGPSTELCCESDL